MKDKTPYEYLIELKFTNLTTEDFDELITNCALKIREEIKLRYIHLELGDDGNPQWKCEDPFYVMAAEIWLKVKNERRMSLQQFKVLGKFCDFPIDGYNPAKYKYF
jgi:hypothetical protein